MNGAVQFLNLLDVHAHTVILHTYHQTVLLLPDGELQGACGGLLYQSVKNGILNDGLKDKAECHGVVRIYRDIIEYLKTIAVPFFYDKDIILYMAQLLCNSHKFPIILSEIIAEDLSQLLTDITDVKHLFHCSHGADGFQRVVKEMGIDLKLQVFQLRFLVLKFPDVVFLDQGIQVKIQVIPADKVVDVAGLL